MIAISEERLIKEPEGEHVERKIVEETPKNMNKKELEEDQILEQEKNIKKKKNKYEEKLRFLSIYWEKAIKTKNIFTKLQYAIFLKKLILNLEKVDVSSIQIHLRKKRNFCQKIFQSNEGKRILETVSITDAIRSLNKELIDFLKKLSLSNTHSRLPVAQRILGDCYENGVHGVKKNIRKALFLYFQASKGRDGYSSYRCAVLYEKEKKMYTHSIFYYRKAASLGNTKAMHRLALIYINGEMKQKIQAKEAFMWMKRAVTHGKPSPEALYDLASFYQIKIGVLALEYDNDHAFNIYQQASEMNHSKSIYMMGLCYEKGLLGREKDPFLAFDWYKKGADLEHASSEYKIAKWFFKNMNEQKETLVSGKDFLLETDFVLKYLFSAAKKGHTKSERILGLFYEKGIGVNKCFLTAISWYKKSSKKGDKKAKEKLKELSVFFVSNKTKPYL